jgi:hypothetical protein
MANNAIQLDANELALLAPRICDEINQATIDGKAYREAVLRGRDVIAGKSDTSKLADWQSKVCIPLIKATRNALHSRMMRGLLGVTPYYHIEPSTKGAKPFAADLERHFQLQLESQTRLTPAMDSVFQSTYEDGTGIAVLRFAQGRRRVQRWARPVTEIIDPLTLQIQTQIGNPEAVESMLYWGDRVEIVPVGIENIGTFPAAHSDFQTADGTYMRSSVTGNDLLEGVRAGTYDAAAVESLRDYAGDVDDVYNSDEARRRQVESITPRTSEFTSRPFTITEVYRKYRPGNAQDQPLADWLFTIHEKSKTILRAVPNPWWLGKFFRHGTRPIVNYRAQSGKFGLYADSLVDLEGQLQTAIVGLIRLVIDGMMLGVNPELLIDAGLGEKVIKELAKRRGPGGYIPIPGLAALGDKIRPMNTGYNPIQAIPLLESILKWAERSTGVPETFTGMPMPGNVTATEIDRMVSEGQEQLAMQIDRLSGTLRDTGEMILDFTYQFQGWESMKEVWRLANPDSKNSLYDALQEEYTIIAAGTKESSSKAVRSRQQMELFTMLTNSPIALPFLMAKPERRYALVRDTVETMDVRNAERYLGTEDEAKQMMEAAPGPGPVPSPIPGAGPIPAAAMPVPEVGNAVQL